MCQGTISNCSACAGGFLYTDALHRCSLTCPAGYILYSANNSCLALCPGTYYNLSNVCTQCPTDCLSCVSANNCTSCNTGLILYNGLCYASCPPSVPYLVNNECVSCDIANCKTCSNALCGSCQAGYLLIQYLQCIQNCPSGQTYNASILECVVIKNDTDGNNTDGNKTVDNTTTSSTLTLTFAPAPVGIGAVAAFLTLLLVRAQHPEMSLVNSFLPILSVFTLGSAIVNGVFYYL